MAHDATLAAPRLELARERGDLRLEPGGGFTRLGVPSRHFGQPLMREGKGKMVRHAVREVEVMFAESIDLACQEEDRPEDIFAERHRHTQSRFHPETLEHASANRVGRDLRADIVHDVPGPD